MSRLFVSALLYSSPKSAVGNAEMARVLCSCRNLLHSSIVPYFVMEDHDSDDGLFCRRTVYRRRLQNAFVSILKLSNAFRWATRIRFPLDEQSDNLSWQIARRAWPEMSRGLVSVKIVSDEDAEFKEDYDEMLEYCGALERVSFSIVRIDSAPRRQSAVLRQPVLFTGRRLRWLYLNGGSYTRVIEHFPVFLKHLRLFSCEVEESGFRALAGKTGLVSLHLVEVARLSGRCFPEVFEGLRVTSLKIANCPRLRWTKGIGKLFGLHFLCLKRLSLREKCDVRHMAGLENLCLDDPSLVEGLGDGVFGCFCLEHYWFEDRKNEQKNFANFSYLEQKNRRERPPEMIRAGGVQELLNLKTEKIGFSCVDMLSGNYSEEVSNCRLQELHLFGCLLPRNLNFLSSFSQIVVIDIQGDIGQFYDMEDNRKEMFDFSFLPTLSNLKILRLSVLAVDTTSLGVSLLSLPPVLVEFSYSQCSDFPQIFCCISHQANLEKLNLFHSAAEIGDSLQDSFFERFPKLKVVNIGGCSGVQPWSNFRGKIKSLIKYEIKEPVLFLPGE